VRRNDRRYRAVPGDRIDQGEGCAQNTEAVSSRLNSLRIGSSTTAGMVRSKKFHQIDQEKEN